ncbi:MAG TPA: MarR family transcriptional regulator [Actinomycetota bacterium]
MTAQERTNSKQQLATAVMAALIRLNKERLRENAERLRRYDLTTQQVWLLAELPEGEDQGVPIGSLAEALHCHGSNITGMVDRLEARGLVARQPSRTDRRVKFVALTPSGSALRDKVIELARQPVRALLDQLSGDQLETLSELLDKACAGVAPLPRHHQPAERPREA